MNILGLIPARGGSKGIPRKNLYPVLGKPLIAYTIEAALAAELIDDVVVSTDDKEIASCAIAHNAQVPFLRPRKLAEDGSGATEVVQHAIDHYFSQKKQLDYIVYLQPTSPLRTAKMIDEAIAVIKNSNADSLVSVIDVPHQFSVMSQMVESQGYLKPAMGDQIGPLRRQEKQQFVARNGPAILITRPQTLAEYGSLYGEKILSYKMDLRHSLDIDHLDDLQQLSWYLNMDSET